MGENRICQNCKRNFVIEPDDFYFYERIKVPPPTFCPLCRMQRRMTWRNERTLHRNTCAKSGQKIISCFSKDSPFTVYDRDIWWSDAWDPIEYGLEYDFSRPFFEQFKQLFENVPQPNLFIGKCINTSYGNYIGGLRNSFLVSASWTGENINYGSRCNYCKDSMDMFATFNCQFCYEDVTVTNSYETFFSQNADSCVSSYFLYDCRNCTDCFGCTNLRNKSNCLWNEQLTKEEYREKVKNLNVGSYEGLQEARRRFEILKTKAIRRFANIVNSSKVSGDNISHAYNSYHCFDVAKDIKDCKFIMNSGEKLYTSYDGYGVGVNTDLLYESLDSGVNSSRQLFCLTVWECLNAEYSINCHGSNNIFGCVGLRNKNYCILNKQYPKTEYENLRDKIIGQMKERPYVDKKGIVYKYGEFFPPELSPFGYNETVANNYFPLSSESIKENGYNFAEREEPEYAATCKARDLPDHIKNVEKDILREIMECASCDRVYKIIGEELKFLKKFVLPLPRKCFECRHLDRFRQTNFPWLYRRRCMCGSGTSPQTTTDHEHTGQCENEFETTCVPPPAGGPSTDGEIVYCEQCYQREVYDMISVMNVHENNYAFIDAQNVHLGVRPERS